MRFQFLAAAALVSISAVGHADTFQFNFGNGSYVFDLSSGTPAAVTTSTDVYYDSTNLADGMSYRFGLAEFGPTAAESGVGDASLYLGEYGVYDSGGVDYEVYSSGPFFTGPTSAPVFQPGTYYQGGLSLTITDLTPSAATPEPSSMALLSTGLLGVAGVLRKRFARA